MRVSREEAGEEVGRSRDGQIVRLLLEGLDPRDFISKHWNASIPLHLSGDERRFDSLISLEDLKAAFSSPACDVRVGFSTNHGVENPLTAAPNSGWGTSAVSRTSAARLFQAGGTINLRELNACCPSAGSIARRLKSELCFPGTVVSEALVSPPGGGFAAYHIDPVAGFTLQLRGKKIWSVCRRPAVAWPRRNAQLDPGGKPIFHLNSEPESPWETLPAVDESQVDTHELGPGSVLYVPPGHWHRVQSGASVAVSVLFYFADNLELAPEPFRSELYTDSRFRRLPIGWREPGHASLHPDVVEHYEYRLRRVAELLERARQRSGRSSSEEGAAPCGSPSSAKLPLDG